LELHKFHSVHTEGTMWNKPHH